MNKIPNDASLMKPKRPTLTLGLSNNIKEEIAKKVAAEKGLVITQEKESKAKDWPQAPKLPTPKAELKVNQLLSDPVSEIESNKPKSVDKTKKLSKEEISKERPLKEEVAKDSSTTKEPNTVKKLSDDEKISANKRLKTIEKLDNKDDNKKSIAGQEGASSSDQRSLGADSLKENPELTEKLEVEGRSTKNNDSKEDSAPNSPASHPRNWLIDPKQYKKMLADFSSRYPDAFSVPVKPLAIGINYELIQSEPEYDKSEIEKFLKVYCIKKEYQSSLILNAERVNLKGEVTSLVGTPGLIPKDWLIDPRQYRKMLTNFRNKYPDAFSIPARPFAVNIQQQLIEAKPEYSKTEIRKFLKVYCGDKGYRKSVVLNAERVDLNGAVASLVTEEQLAKGREKSKTTQIDAANVEEENEQ